MHKLSRVIILLSGIVIFTAQVSLAQEASSSTAQVEAQQLEQRKPIERELKAGETHAYKITLEAGQFLNAAANQRGIDVVVRIFAPDGSKIAEIDSPNGTQGDEPIALEAKTAGTYRIEIASLDKDAKPGRYEIRINELLSAKDYAARLAENRRKQQASIAWLKANAITIKTVEAGNGFQDLQPLKKVFKDTRFVGLGEETHGTREFFQFKHRMLEFLVREMGFRVFAIEASYAACQNINDYVMGKTDDGAKALDSQGFWTWNTEEVRAMMDWMRKYNQSVPVDRRVKFVGFDIQNNDSGKEKLLAYLKRVAPERAARTETFFKVNDQELSNTAFSGKGDKAKDALAKFVELKNQYNDLFVFLEINGANLATKSNAAEYEQMREYARVVAQYIDAYSRRDLGSVVQRDLYMADNFRRLVEREPAGTRFVVWAHNGHISTTDNDGAYPTFGYHLRRFYGKDYYALGFSFNQGSFQSREAQPKDPSKRMLMSFTATAAPAESIDWYLAQTGAKILLVDFRSSRKNVEIGEWLAAPHPMRSVGSTYAPASEGSSFALTTLSKEYDGLFFIDTATRARPNASVKNVASAQ
ncbi:MAG: erythromycin esterase [Acidobacteriota bacterium]|nr:erythromycin esterase [Acidobacteriota bacterium]